MKTTEPNKALQHNDHVCHGKMKQAFTLLAFLCFAIPMHAWHCGEQPSIAQAVARSSLVFIGRATKMELRSRGDENRSSAIREVVVCEFSSVESLKGDVGADKKVLVTTGPVEANLFKVGFSYLVYAETRDGELWTTVCHRTRPVVIIPEDQDFGMKDLKIDDALKTEVPEIKKILGQK